uniref:Uncharacterized protein n=1 Tax=Megaselia scalaris TaxID=36166 RepID=T1GTC8_MEGSC
MFLVSISAAFMMSSKMLKKLHDLEYGIFQRLPLLIYTTPNENKDSRIFATGESNEIGILGFATLELEQSCPFSRYKVSEISQPLNHRLL